VHLELVSLIVDDYDAPTGRDLCHPAIWAGILPTGGTNPAQMT
jgi:phosphatidylethanolamine-binding protein (PEBP) family uncharacterized protein